MRKDMIFYIKEMNELSDIIKYSLLNSHKDFKTLPFSRVDGLIFAQMAYLNYGKLSSDKPLFSRGSTFSKIAEHEDFSNIFAFEIIPDRNLTLFNSMAYSKRYGKVKINYHENILDYEKKVQFSATTFILPDGNACISFRGTDSTITGWREDFDMLYNDTVPAQLLSVKYLNKVASKIKGKIAVVGHSKGGNLAIYASVMCSPKAKNKIIEVQSFDSPGFTKEFVTSEKYLQMEEKIVKYVPEQSIFGMLLNDTNKYQIIKSKGEGVFQHDPYMWIVENNDFVTGNKIHNNAKFITNTFEEWMGSHTPEQRKLFVDSVFKIIEDTNVQNVDSFIEWGEYLKDNNSILIDTLKELDPESRTFMLKFLGTLFPSARDSILTGPKNLIKSTYDRIKIR